MDRMAQGRIGASSGRAFSPVQISAPRLPHSFAALPDMHPSEDEDTTMEISALIAEMDVDQTVRPVAHTVGGSAAGYARWNKWLAAEGLKTYAKRRNDSLDQAGVSRGSAYLNCGMVR